MKHVILIILSLGLFSCNKEKKNDVSASTEFDNKLSFDLETMYYLCDTVIRVQDTVKIVNSLLDTTIIETGIFTFLQYDYPLTTPQKIVELSKTAIQYEKQGKAKESMEFFKKVIDFYYVERPQQLELFSCLNGYYSYEVNSAILCSYAYEQLGDLNNSIKTLQPFLANVEAWNCKIHERYIQLCIKKFGIDKVKEELNTCGATISLKEQIAPEIDNWVVNVFGADIGVGNSCETKYISPTQADSLVKQMYFYRMIGEKKLFLKRAVHQCAYSVKKIN